MARKGSDFDPSIHLREGTGAYITPEEIERILCAGGDIVVAGIKRYIRTKAKHPTGALESTISYDTYEESARPAAVMGWIELPLQRKTKEYTIRLKNSRHGRTRTQKASSKFVDKNGKTHYVRTVADYGRILEFSDTRVFRHMEGGLYATESEAVRKMEQMSDELMQKAADEAFRRAGL